VSESRDAAISVGGWILSAESLDEKTKWRLTLDVPGPNGMFVWLDIPPKPTSLQLRGAIRSIDVEAPSTELVEKFMHFYPGHIDSGA
jgi:hypothetical protein